MNIVEHVSLLDVGASFGYMPRSSVAGSSGSIMFNFLRNCQTDFQSGCTSLQPHQQWRSVPLSTHPRQQMLVTVWRRKNTPPLLMGLLAGTTTLEISLAVPQKIGHSTT